MGYATLYECGTKYKTPFFTPTGPLFRAFPADCLPFAVRCVYRSVRILYRPPPVPAPHAPPSTDVTRYYYDIICEL